MAIDPDLISEGLDELAAQATPLRATSGAIARRIRARRRGRRAAVAAAGVAAVLVTAVATWPGGGRPPQTAAGSGVASPLVPTGQQAVSFHGVEVLAPAAWPVNAAHCGVPTRDTVLLLDDTAVAACAMRGPVVDLVRLDSYQAYTRAFAFAAPGGRGSTSARTVLGRAATLTRTTLPTGQTALSLAIPDLDVVVTAQSRDPALVQRIISSVRLARPLDTNGCADPLADLTPTPADRAMTELAPGGFTQASLCVYDDLRLTRSVRLTRADASTLAAQLNGLHPGLQTFGPTQACRDGYDTGHRAGYLIHFSFLVGPVSVGVRPAGCVDLGATNGVRTGRLTQKLLATLGALSGVHLTSVPAGELLPR